MGFRAYDPTPIGWGESSHQDQKSLLSFLSWHVSVVLGYLALLIFLVVCVGIVATKVPALKEKLFAILPDSVVRALSEHEKARPEAEEQLRPKIVEGLKKTLASPKVSSPSSASRSRLAVGMTTMEVLQAQGPPTRITGDVWHYGDSTVTFQGGRVVAVQTSPAAPVKVR